MREDDAEGTVGVTVAADRGVDLLPIVFALRKAYVQYEVWLASLMARAPWGGHAEGRHRSAGLGVPTAEVAEVYFYGDTHAMWWRRKMYARGLQSFMQLPFEEGHALTDAWFAEPGPCHLTQSETMRTFHMLRRAQNLGLAERTSEYGRTAWLPIP